MARSDFGGTPGDTIWGERPDQSAYFTSGTITCWDAQSGGTQYTDLLLAGSPVTQLVVGADAQIPVFQGPDGVTSLWISANNGPRAILRAAGAGGGSPTVTDNGNGTLTLSGKTFYSKAGVDTLLTAMQTDIATNAAAIASNAAAITALLPNAILVVWNGTAWTYKGNVITARPTTDPNYPVIALYGTAEPTWIIGGTDAWLEDTGS